MKPTIVFLLVLLAILAVLFGVLTQREADPPPPVAGDPPAPVNGVDFGRLLPLWSVIPFAGVLLSIALFPLFAPRFWAAYFGAVMLFWSLAFALPFLYAFRDRAGAAGHEILQSYAVDYLPFIILLWSLYTVSGGIVVEGSLRGTPFTNLVLLVLGTAAASWVGTTGASLLMIRPLLRANAARRHRSHIIVFFIFLVSNLGGSLTPLGDPPVFLGFLHGVPFFWTFSLFPEMLAASGLVLALFLILDSYYYSREPRLPPVPVGETVRLRGLHNLLFLAGIVGGVLMSGFLKLGGIRVLGIFLPLQDLLRDAVLLMMGAAAYVFTRQELRDRNGFTWHAIREVAILFAGIFMTIIPALAILKDGKAGALAPLIAALETPAHYFWAAGVLSSFLDNAPTYLAFFNSALGRFFPGIPEPEAVVALLREQAIFLKAITCGAVFMGANTYIGNAPNFMVKAIAEEVGVRMPTFFGYLFKYSLPILLPIYVIITILFF